MKRLREILRIQYIGAIVVALLANQAILSLVTVIVTPLQWYILRNSKISPYLTGAINPGFLLVEGFQNLVSLILYALAAWILGKWLYSRVSKNSEPETAALEGVSV
jgi:hypothetical protein